METVPMQANDKEREFTAEDHKVAVRNLTMNHIKDLEERLKKEEDEKIKKVMTDQVKLFQGALKTLSLE